jgi:hypothetical protein
LKQRSKELKIISIKEKINDYFRVRKSVSKNLDEQLTAKATTGFLEANAGQVIYNGGKSIKIPNIVFGAMKDYNRDTGFPDISSTFTYEEKVMSQDRGAKLKLDKMDVNETNFTATSATFVAEYQRTRIVPEVDLYRWNALYSAAPEANVTTAVVTASNVYADLTADIAKLQDVAGVDAEIVVAMSIPVLNLLCNSDKFTRYINVAEFAKGTANSVVKTINGVPIVGVPTSRFNTGITKNAAGGYTLSGDPIGWLVFPKAAPIAVAKTGDIFIKEPDADFDGYKISFRKYHDLWVPGAKAGGVFARVNVAPNLEG